MNGLKPGAITWEDAATICDEYAEVLATEFTGHELHVDEHGTLRWVEDPVREQEYNDLFMNGADKKVAIMMQVKASEA